MLRLNRANVRSADPPRRATPDYSGEYPGVGRGRRKKAGPSNQEFDTSDYFQAAPGCPANFHENQPPGGGGMAKRFASARKPCVYEEYLPEPPPWKRTLINSVERS
ncbi:hypothetical protein KM043_003896 [Ampulex compressa]|nr:hypothetical protein KM043_003896 [Ampulex compressa]